MVAKFNKKITEYKYILSFDLAKYLTGFSLLDIQNNKIITTGTVDMNGSDVECFWGDYYVRMSAAFGAVLSHVAPGEKMLVVKEKLPSQAGRFTTVQALQGLAQAHSIFDLVAYRLGAQYGFDVYDYDGVHAVSVKAYFRKATEIEKPSKKDIAEAIQSWYPDYDLIASKKPLDITDSLAVTLTLLKSKYNSDIDAEIKNIKKDIKTYKSDKKVEELKQKIEFLTNLKV